MKTTLIRRILPLIFLLAVALCAQAKTYLVAVGVADYSGYPSKVNNLRLPPADARAIASLFSKNGDMTYSLLINSNATKANILSSMKKVFARAGKDDAIIFFFSGHGYPGGICAADGKLSYDQVRAAMAGSRSRNKMMFVDACRSGSVRYDKKTSGQSLASAKKASVMLFLSSRTNENSQEKPSMKNGYFTTYLIKGLRGNADANRDRIITARELYDFVHAGVTRLSKGEQHPVMWGNFSPSMTVVKW